MRLSAKNSVDSVRRDMITNMQICIPSLPEQTKIANFLTAVDEKIAQLTQKGDLLARYKKGVMQQIFSRQLRFKDDDGRDFPEWEERELKDIAQINPKTASLPDEFIYIDLESVEKGILLKETTISKDDAPSRAQRLLKKEDVLFQMVRPYQTNNLFFDKIGNYVASTGYAQIRAYENARYLYHFLHLNDFVAEVINRCTGTSYPAINSSDLATISIQIPVKEEQSKIANFLTAIDDKISHNQTQLNAMKQYKQGLLQQLFV
jgi:type I restriction enzyme S subunit